MARRNEKCPCGSGTKYKKCCGKPVSKQAMSYADLRTLYSPQQREADRLFLLRWGFPPHPSQLYTAMQEDEETQVTMVLSLLSSMNAPPDFVHAVKTMRRMLTPRNNPLWSAEDRETFNNLRASYEGSKDGNQGSTGVPAGQVPASSAG